MVVVSGRGPAVRHEESRPEHLLADERPDLDPDPGGEDVRGVLVRFDEEDVVFHGVEVEEGGEAEHALTDDEFPA